jgi:hypothetical protein
LLLPDFVVEDAVDLRRLRRPMDVELRMVLGARGASGQPVTPSSRALVA